MIYPVCTVLQMNTQSCLYDRIGGREGLELLLRHFYADVRQHAVLGPIFNKHIDDWSAHLAKIASFWARLTGGPSGYLGQMPAKHLRLGIEEHHFNTWLQLWDLNCCSHLKKTEAEEMICLAHEIGRRLKSIVSAESKRTEQTSLFTLGALK